MKQDVRHIPVLLGQVMEVLKPRNKKVIVDCTVGLGGHSAELLKKLYPDGHLVGIDFDPHNLEIARKNLSAIGSNFTLVHNNFAAVQTVLAETGFGKADGILADIGVASTQIDDPARGFSYRRPGPLDMRMDPTRGRPASELLQRLSEGELAEALGELGDEEDAEKIAKLIVQRRREEMIDTTQALMAIVCEARDFTLLRAAGAKLHPAARTFQALRILVNRELANLDNLLRVLPTCLKPGGVGAIISFHSGEDRRVKKAFKDGLREGTYADISEEPLLADAGEVLKNPRSRSAKLRWARLK